MFSSFSNFSKIVLFPCHPVIRMCWCIHLLLANRIFFVFVGNFLFSLYSTILSQYLFSLPLLASTFWFISSTCIMSFSSWVAFCFPPILFLGSSSVLSSLPVVIDFFICVSSRMSHPGFKFLFVFFKGITILSQINFSPA